MPGTTTPFAFPYPLGTEPVRDGDDAIKNLAVKINDTLNLKGLTKVITAANAVYTANAAGQGSTAFGGAALVTNPPAVIAQSGDSTQNVRIEIINATTTGFNWAVKNATTDAAIPNAVVRINWIAVG